MKKAELLDIIFNRQREEVKGMDSTRDENGKRKNDYLSTIDFWKHSGKAEAYSEIYQLLMKIDIEAE